MICIPFQFTCERGKRQAKKEEKQPPAKILNENKQQAADLLVPLDVDVHEGASWFEAK